MSINVVTATPVVATPEAPETPMKVYVYGPETEAKLAYVESVNGISVNTSVLPDRNASYLPHDVIVVFTDDVYPTLAKRSEELLASAVDVLTYDALSELSTNPKVGFLVPALVAFSVNNAGMPYTSAVGRYAVRFSALQNVPTHDEVVTWSIARAGRGILKIGDINSLDRLFLWRYQNLTVVKSTDFINQARVISRV